MNPNDPNAPVPAPPVPAQVPVANVPATTPPAQNPWQTPGVRQRLGPGALILIVLILYTLFRSHQNPNEALATRVTKAIVANDMKPVEPIFNAADREKLENRMLVGRLSQDLNDLGKFNSVQEDTPNPSPTGYHRFKANFEKGTWVEDMRFDSEGKIVVFRVHAPDAKAP
jgi:hypothetical protein